MWTYYFISFLWFVFFLVMLLLFHCVVEFMTYPFTDKKFRAYNALASHTTFNQKYQQFFVYLDVVHFDYWVLHSFVENVLKIVGRKCFFIPIFGNRKHKSTVVNSACAYISCALCIMCLFKRCKSTKKKPLSLKMHWLYSFSILWINLFVRFILLMKSHRSMTDLFLRRIHFDYFFCVSCSF